MREAIKVKIWHERLTTRRIFEIWRLLLGQLSEPPQAFIREFTAASISNGGIRQLIGWLNAEQRPMR